jgi:NitT/TauT family transport system permease protein
MKQQLIGIIILFFFWQLVSLTGLIDPFFLPSPIDTLAELVDLVVSQDLAINFWQTLQRVLIAFSIACLIGFPVGLFLGQFRAGYHCLEFSIDFFRSTPATAMFPLFLIIFGVSDSSKIGVAAFASALIIIFNTAYGVMQAPKLQLQAVRMMGGSSLELFSNVIIWQSLAHTILGMRQAVSLSLVLIIVTEMFIGAESGLGKKIIDFQITYNIEAMYAVILLTGFTGYALNLIFSCIEAKALHWLEH